MASRNRTSFSSTRPFPIMLLKLAFYAPRNSVLRQKNAKSILDSQNNATLVSKNALLIVSKT